MTDFPYEFFGGQAAEAEFVPTINQLSVDLDRRSLLDHCIAEIDDDPSVTLGTLSKAEGKRLSFRLVGSTDFAGNARGIASLMNGVDYFIAEHTLPRASSASRRVHDIALNLGLRGVALQAELSGQQDNSDEADSATSITITSDLQHPDSFMAAYARTPDFQYRSPLPFVRTMGLADYDVTPDIGLQVENATEWEQKILGGVAAGLLTFSNETLLSAYAASFTFSVPKALALAQQRYTAVSTIAANAVRWHPDRKHITIGVLQRTCDDRLQSDLLRSGKLIGLSSTQVPLITGPEGVFPLPDPRDQALQEAMIAPNHRPSQATLERALCSNYLRSTLLHTYEGNAERAERATRVIDSRLSAAAVSSLLQVVDEAKTAKLSRFNWSRTPDDVRRGTHIRKAILSQPIIKILTKDALHDDY